MNLQKSLLDKIALIVETNKDFVVVYVNDIYTSWTGQTAEKVIGLNLLDLFSEYNDIEKIDYFLVQLSQGTIASVSIKMIFGNRVNWLKLVGTSIRKGNELTGFLISGVKIDAEKQIEELKKNDLLADFQHDLKVASGYVNALLPSVELFRKITHKQGFFFYMPMRGIGGDWYWFSEKNDKFFLMIGDVMGHGINASIIATILLTTLRVTDKDADVIPSSMLDFVHAKLYKIFHKEKENKEITVDCIAMIYDMNAKLLQYASANFPIYIGRSNELIRLETDKRGLNLKISRELNHFENHTLTLNSGDWIWSFSDGVKDQFDDISGKPIGIKRLKEVLISASREDNAEEFLKMKKDEWMGSASQTDDITLFGIKVV